MTKGPPTDELPDPDKTGFYMLDPLRSERIDDSVFGIRWRLWSVMLQKTDDRGFIGHTQNSLAIQFDMTERQVRKHYSVFKAANMIEKCKDSEGRVRFRVCPEYFFNFNRISRNKEVRERRSADVIYPDFKENNKKKTA